MLKYIFITLMFLMFFVSSANAGAGHAHGPSAPASEQQIVDAALNVVSNLIKKDIIPSSWADIKPFEYKQKTFKNNPEWVVSFNNPSAVGIDKQTLYVFFSLDGSFLAANYSGN